MSQAIKEAVSKNWNYENGTFTHKVTGSNGARGEQGRLYISALGKNYSVAQLVFLFELDVLPETNSKMVIDHVDGNHNNNQLSNLRFISQKENAKNNKRLRNQKLPTGVYVQAAGTNARIKIYDGHKFTHNRILLTTPQELKSFLRLHFTQINQAQNKFEYVQSHFEPKINWKYQFVKHPQIQNHCILLGKKNSTSEYKPLVELPNLKHAKVFNYLQNNELVVSKLKKIVKE